MPFLRMFNTDSGPFDIPLTEDKVIIGRDPKNADVVVDESTVSRQHALINFAKSQYHIQDSNSKTGTFINGEKIKTAVLRNKDNIQIGQTVLEFFEKAPSEVMTDDENNEDCRSTMQGIQSSFKRLPSRMGLSYRIIAFRPDKIFATGDTIMLGRGGMLLDGVINSNLKESIIEVELKWPNGNKRTVLGEIISVIPQQNTSCIKLHKIPSQRYAEILDKAQRGSWITMKTEEV
jgi:pSer/pThr/pTyr-binding forkhead associated (FHA) protein